MQSIPPAQHRFAAKDQCVCWAKVVTPSQAHSSLAFTPQILSIPARICRATNLDEKQTLQDWTDNREAFLVFSTSFCVSAKPLWRSFQTRIAIKYFQLPNVLLKWWLSWKTAIKHCLKFCRNGSYLSQLAPKTRHSSKTRQTLKGWKTLRLCVAQTKFAVIRKGIFLTAQSCKNLQHCSAAFWCSFWKPWPIQAQYPDAIFFAIWDDPMMRRHCPYYTAICLMNFRWTSENWFTYLQKFFFSLKTNKFLQVLACHSNINQWQIGNAIYKNLLFKKWNKLGICNK